MRQRQFRLVRASLTRIRHYGLLANRGKQERLAHIRALLGRSAPIPAADARPQTAAEWLRRLLGVDSHAYRAILRRAKIRQSMSRAANCYDNAFMESCFGTIKTELEMTEYQNSRQARQDIASYLAYYNHERRHSSLGYLTPAAFEKQINPLN